MIRRRPTRLLLICLVVLNIGDVLALALALAVVGVALAALAVVGVVGALAALVPAGVFNVVLSGVRRTQPSGLPGGVGWLRVSLGGNMRCLLQACTSVDRLVDYLLDRAVKKLPAAASARFAEEWRDHRTQCSGWRLVWWALCVRATAMRTVAELGPARLPHDS